jgi:hypothetical protein
VTRIWPLSPEFGIERPQLHRYPWLAKARSFPGCFLTGVKTTLCLVAHFPLIQPMRGPMKHFLVKMANKNRFVAPHPESVIKRSILCYARFYCPFPLSKRLGPFYTFDRLGW